MFFSLTFSLQSMNLSFILPWKMSAPEGSEEGWGRRKTFILFNNNIQQSLFPSQNLTKDPGVRTGTMSAHI